MKLLFPSPRNSARSRAVTRLLVVVLAVAAGVAAKEVWRAASDWNEKISLDGVSNFGRVNSRLYRGAQPTPVGYAELKRLGIDIIVKLNVGHEGFTAEKDQVESLGMRFVSFPWDAQHEPTHEQVVAFLTLLRDNPDKTIFVHCYRGADRTGVMVALYRITFDHWTTDQAIEEMEAFRYRYLFLPHLQHFVEAYPAELSSDPALQALEPAATPSH